MSVNEVVPSFSGLNRTTFLNRMKEQYLDKWADAVNSKTKALGMLGKKAGTIIGGRRSLTSVMTNLSQSAGVGLFEGDDLPEPSAPSYQQLEIFPRTLYCRVRFTGHVERAGRAGNSAVFAAGVKEQLASARKQHTIAKNRMMYLNPHQILGTVSAYNHGTGVVTLYGRNLRTSAANDRHKYGVFYLRENQAISFVNRSGGNVAAGGATLNDNTVAANVRTIASIDTSSVDSPTITLNAINASDFSAAADNVTIIPFRGRINSPSSGAGEDSDFAYPNGLLNLVTDSTYKAFLYGVDRSLGANRFLNGNVFNNGGSLQAYDEERVSLLMDQVAENRYANDNEPDVILCNHSIRRAHVRAVRDERRFTPTTGKRGFEKQAYSHGDQLLPIETDKDCPPGLMWLLDKMSFGTFVESPIHMPDDGERFVVNKDAREVVLAESFNVACRTPAGNGLVDDQDYSTTNLISPAP